MQKSERKALCYKERQVQNYEHNTPRSQLKHCPKFVTSFQFSFFLERKIARIHMDARIHIDARIHQKYLSWVKKRRLYVIKSHKCKKANRRLYVIKRDKCKKAKRRLCVIRETNAKKRTEGSMLSRETSAKLWTKHTILTVETWPKICDKFLVFFFLWTKNCSHPPKVP
jgi:hypothetical protein